MSEPSETPTGQPVPASSSSGETTADGWSAPAPSAPPSSGGGPTAVVEDRPEIAVGAAFAGGLALALILKRLAS